MKCFGYEKQKSTKILCKIFLLDDTQILHEVQDSSRGQDLMDVVCKHLNLLETAYFGLRFVDGSGQPHWLNLSARTGKQLRDLHPLNLYFGVKFYAMDPCKLAEEITRYQFFLQLKQDILQSRLPVPAEMGAELFAYAVQSELGDYDAMQHTNGYISEFRFMPNQSQELEARVSELHKRLLGQVPAAAEIAFLDKVKWIDLYGADLHPVLGEDCMEYFIALVPSGILVLRGKNKVGQYYWPRVVKFYRKARYFMLKVREKNEDEKTFGFELPSEAASKHLEKCCRDHETFFRLASEKEAVAAGPGREVSSRIIGLSQRFRSSLSGGGGGRRAHIMTRETSPDLSSPHHRPQATVVRVPSRRYQRRFGQQTYSSDDPVISNKENCPKVSSDFPQVISDGMPSVTRTHSRSSVMAIDQKSSAVVWDNEGGGLFSTSSITSPYSVYTEGRSRRRSSSKSRNGHSDNESQGSRTSRRSRHSHRSSSSRRCRHHDNDDHESDVGSSHSRRRHRRRHRCSRGESSEQLVDSHGQWLEIQRSRQENLSQDCTTRANLILMNDESQNRMNQQSSATLVSEYSNNRENRLRSDYTHKSDAALKKMNSNYLPPQVRKFIENNITDPGTDLQFIQVAVDSHKRYSPKSKYKVMKEVPPRNHGHEDADDVNERIEPVYSNLPAKNRTSLGNGLRSAGSRAPVCADDFELSLESHFRDNEMATEL